MKFTTLVILVILTFSFSKSSLALSSNDHSLQIDSDEIDIYGNSRVSHHNQITDHEDSEILSITEQIKKMKRDKKRNKRKSKKIKQGIKEIPSAIVELKKYVRSKHKWNNEIETYNRLSECGKKLNDSKCDDLIGSEEDDYRSHSLQEDIAHIEVNTNQQLQSQFRNSLLAYRHHISQCYRRQLQDSQLDTSVIIEAIISISKQHYGQSKVSHIRWSSLPRGQGYLYLSRCMGQVINGVPFNFKSHLKFKQAFKFNFKESNDRPLW